MIIISDYTLVLTEDFGVFVESSENSHICPVCQGTLHYRDSRPRIRKKEVGTKEQLMIRRFRCQNCHAYHNELPDCLVPYKHYEAEVIAGVLDEVILPDDLDSEDYPSFSTMLRWLQWFRENLQRMEGYLRTAGYQILNLGEGFLFSSDSLLDKIRNRYQNWLEQLLRLIYNSGGFLVPVLCYAVLPAFNPALCGHAIYQSGNSVLACTHKTEDMACGSDYLCDPGDCDL